MTINYSKILSNSNVQSLDDLKENINIVDDLKMGLEISEKSHLSSDNVPTNLIDYIMNLENLSVTQTENKDYNLNFNYIYFSGMKDNVINIHKFYPDTAKVVMSKIAQKTLPEDEIVEQNIPLKLAPSIISDGEQTLSYVVDYDNNIVVIKPNGDITTQDGAIITQIKEVTLEREPLFLDNLDDAQKARLNVIAEMAQIDRSDEIAMNELAIRIFKTT